MLDGRKARQWACGLVGLLVGVWLGGLTSRSFPKIRRVPVVAARPQEESHGHEDRAGQTAEATPEGASAIIDRSASEHAGFLHDRLWQGLGGNDLCSSTEYEVIEAGHGRMLSLDDPTKQEAYVDARRTREEAAARFAVALYEEQLGRDEQLGAAPYDDKRFQLIALLGARPITFAGRDFDVSASPRASVDFYALREGVQPTELSDAARQQAICFLDAWDRTHRAHLAALVSLTKACAAQYRDNDDEAAAYAVIDGKVFLLGLDKLHEIDLVRREYDAVESRVLGEIMRLAGLSGR